MVALGGVFHGAVPVLKVPTNSVVQRVWDWLVEDNG